MVAHRQSSLIAHTIRERDDGQILMKRRAVCVDSDLLDSGRAARVRRTRAANPRLKTRSVSLSRPGDRPLDSLYVLMRLTLTRSASEGACREGTSPLAPSRRVQVETHHFQRPR